MSAAPKQIASREQENILRALAEAAVRPGARFLEVGSWLGESAAILGKVAQSHDGHLFCVDWWKGSPGTELFAAAQREDIFSRFWERIRELGLEDAVVPIRGRSDLAAAILKEGAFDLVFIDGDHRYGGVLRDIQAYSSLVRSGGILCGHDCEGRIGDFERGFLDQGKESDYFETVHCGVVLAVGESFENYSIHRSIWSVRRRSKEPGWEPTALAVPGVEESLQEQPPPLCCTRTYALFRYGKQVYAVPHALLHGLDVTRKALRERPDVLRSENVDSLLARLNETPVADGSPALIGNHEGYNLVRYAGKVYGVSVELGPLDLQSLDAPRLNEFQAQHMLVMAEDAPQAQQLVDRARCTRLRLELDEKAVHLGALQAGVASRDADLSALREWTARKDGEIASLRKVIAEKEAAIAEKNQAVAQAQAALEATRRAKDEEIVAVRKVIAEKEAVIAEKNQAVSQTQAALEATRRAKDGEIVAIRKVIAEKDAVIAEKNQAVSQTQTALEALRQAKDGEIASLRKMIAEKEAAIADKDQAVSQAESALEALRRANDADVAALRQDLARKDAEIASLWKAIAEKDAEISDKDHAVSQMQAALDALRRADEARPRPGWLLRRLGLERGQ
ncbi:MAG: class I SAM-dependent methyltransferase [Candidatus Brocadiia bacterium]